MFGSERIYIKWESKKLWGNLNIQINKKLFTIILAKAGTNFEPLEKFLLNSLDSEK